MRASSLPFPWSSVWFAARAVAMVPVAGPLLAGYMVAAAAGQAAVWRHILSPFTYQGERKW